jgi:putative transposase
MAKVLAALRPAEKGIRDDQCRIPQVLWERMQPPLPTRSPHPLGCHNPRVDDRKAMDAIFFVLRTGCQWTAAGVFVTSWAQGLEEYNELTGLGWEWLTMDGAMTKSPARW